MKKLILIMLVMLNTAVFSQGVKISQMNPGTPALGTDAFPIQRGNSNFKLTVVDVAGYIGMSGTTWLDPVSSIRDSVACTEPDSGARYIAIATTGGWTHNYIYTCNGSGYVETVPHNGNAVVVIDSSSVYVYNGTSWVPQTMSAASYWAKSGNHIFNINPGSVGINMIPSASYKLDVNGDSRVNNYNLRLGGGLFETKGLIKLANSGSSTRIGVFTNAVERMSFASNATRVGIGIITPQNTLDINGTLQVRNSAIGTSVDSLQMIEGGVFKSIAASNLVLSACHSLFRVSTIQSCIPLTLDADSIYGTVANGLKFKASAIDTTLLMIDAAGFNMSLDNATGNFYSIMDNGSTGMGLSSALFQDYMMFYKNGIDISAQIANDLQMSYSDYILLRAGVTCNGIIDIDTGSVDISITGIINSAKFHTDSSYFLLSFNNDISSYSSFELSPVQIYLTNNYPVNSYFAQNSIAMTNAGFDIVSSGNMGVNKSRILADTVSITSSVTGVLNSTTITQDTMTVTTTAGIVNDKIVMVDTNYTILATDYMVIDTTLTNHKDTLTLPVSPINGQEYLIVVTGAGKDASRLYGNGKSIRLAGEFVQYTAFTNLNYQGRLKYSSLLGYWIVY